MYIGYVFLIYSVTDELSFDLIINIEACFRCRNVAENKLCHSLVRCLAIQNSSSLGAFRSLASSDITVDVVPFPEDLAFGGFFFSYEPDIQSSFTAVAGDLEHVVFLAWNIMVVDLVRAL